MSAIKRPQLRSCTFCHKPGHNKATCPDYNSAPILPAKKPAVKVVIHGRIPFSTQSPHLLNLKTQKNPWLKITSSSPEKNTSLFQHYHEVKETKKILNNQFEKKLPSNLPKINLRKKINNLRDIIIKKLKRKYNSSGLNLSSELPKTKRENNSIKKIISNYLTSWKTSGRPAFVLAMAILIFLVLPIQAHTFYQNLKSTTQAVAANGTEGFLALQESTAAIMTADLSGAANSTNSALNKLNSAVDILNTNHKLLLKIASVVPIVSREVQSRQNIITAGQKIAQGNSFLIMGINSSQKNPEDSLTRRISILTKYLQVALPNYQAALKDLSNIDSTVLPLQYQSLFNDFRLLFAGVLNDLDNLSDLGQTIQEVFGGQGLRRYLLIFQNPHEIRPTGGFIGSFAIMDIKDGKVTNLEVPAGGSYDLQGQLDQFVEPPTPLLLANKRWEFQDANWFPDFPTSAEKMLWFYRHSRQLTADGVIAVNATVLERLLSIIGPVTDEERSLTLSANNAIATIQTVVEEGPEKQQRKPKQILTDLAPKLLQQTTEIKPDQALPLLLSISEALKQKEIQAYFTDNDAQKTVSSFGWAGKILQTRENQDYLFIVNTNIRGEKSDAEIKQTISHQAVIQENGEVINMVTITREHSGIRGEKLYGATNIDYLRIYVPAGSELISVSGFSWPDEKTFRVPDKWTTKDEFIQTIEKEIKIDDNSGTRVTSEFGKTAFGNWIITEPGQISQIQFTYILPFKVFNTEENLKLLSFKKILNSTNQSAHYQLAVQRQSGVETNFDSQIIFPNTWKTTWNDGENSLPALNGMTITAHPLEYDGIWSLLTQKEK
ncbi:MAG: hypothetical protein COU29_01200 [Candidatus Magasanikbacteria bacterium CG10_big_fil_rev_8_21_14_0_10_36_32]|uniref:DUF4012 domain-containing protein n=1 Tax=Candidatus Magasanikbacteria bacterium CG10_big_fil_rev_8_21_14_0_10_36_32 TaxID=1974646 RepID=A0A2M6W6H0_9BACT|nr:MAG: hypothetical protein COU29_01200 [Candidatus Magasanikbacteria bacterium CG10_big_fil_rev_8_21_14_0_10_36_32]